MLRLFLILLSLISFASATVVIQEQSGKIDNFSLEYYYDKSRTLSIDEVSKKTFNKRVSSQFAFGYLEGNSWFKLTLQNNTQNDSIILYLTEPFFEEVELFKYEEDKFKKESIGLFTPLEKRNINDISPAFVLKIEPNTTKTYYIKTFAQFAQFGEFQLYTKENLATQHRLFVSVLYVFYFGGLFIIIIFNLFLFSTLKERIYLYYVSYIFFNTIFVFAFSGLNIYIGLAPWHYELHLSIPFLIIFLILFSNEFLEIKKYLPYAYKILKSLIWIFIAITILTVIDFNPWYQIITKFAFLAYVMLMYVSIRIWIKGHTKAKYYVVAMTVYTASIIIMSAMINGWLENNDLTRYAFLFGSFFEIVFFSLMLANRFHDMQNEKICIQKDLITIKDNNKEFLEQEVKERTNEITNINRQLKSLIDEKEVLLKEVHHRVKNNFQVLHSMIWLESKKDENKNNKGSFDTLIHRIKSMSLVYQLIFDSEELSQIDTQNYFTKIIDGIKKIYGQKRVTINSKIETSKLTMDQAMSLAIITNEIVTNSIKHHDERECVIDFSFLHVNNKAYLVVKDNGTGFNEDNNHNGYGLKMVKQISKKLKNAKLSFTQDEGSKFELSFDLN